MHRVRAATSADTEALGELAAEMVHFHQALDPERYMRIPEPIAPGYGRFLARMCEDPAAVVLVSTEERVDGADDHITGYIYGHMEPASYNELLDACAKLHDLFVVASARRRGIGRALVTEAIARLEGMGAPRILLLSAWQNSKAQSLFTALGFRKTMVEMTRECNA